MAEVEVAEIATEAERRMQGAVDVLLKEFSGLRAGRASTSLLDPVMVEAYGSEMPIAQVGTVGVPESRLLTVQVWDKGLVKAVEKAIRDAGLGLNPSSDGQMVRVPIPALNEERRAELSKVAGRYAEESRVSIRNVRRHALDEYKKAEKEGLISQDENRHHMDTMQKITDRYVKKVDELLVKKESEIMQV